MAERTPPAMTGAPTQSAWIWLEGACLGGLLAFCLTTRSLFDVLLDDRISGVSAPTIHRFLATDYRSEVVRAAGELLALSTVVGIVVGVVVALLEFLRERRLGLPRLRFWPRMVRLVAVSGCVLGWVYLHDVASRPALHQAELFERGGVRAWVQIVAADWLGTIGVSAAGGVLLAAYCFWPLIRRGEYRQGLRQLAVPVGVALGLWGGVEVALKWGLGLGLGLGQAAQTKFPNVLLIAADSLRPDRLDRTRAPHVARLLGRATSFERAYTPLARTFPAWVSIATGQYPQHHGIRHMFPRWASRQRELDTMARRFKGAGYHTAVVGDFAADIFRRIDLGYQHVETPTFTMRELVREHLLKNVPWLLAFVHGRAMRWLVPVIVEMHEATDPQAVTDDAIDEIEHAAGKPFFVTVFYSTTHFPYAAPGPEHRRFRRSGYDGPFRYAKADTLTRDDKMRDSDVAQVRALYDGAVYATDAAIGELLEALERRSLTERTIVVVTADHGEELYEHGRTQGHGDHLQGNEALLVPLVIADPTKPAPHSCREPVSLVDLAPTLLELAHLDGLKNADGRSLVSALGATPPASKPIYSETGLWFTETIAEVPLSRRIPYPDLTQLTEVDRKHSDQIVIRERWEALTIAAKHRMLQEGNLRLLYVPSRDEARFELCVLDADPGCIRDAKSQHPLEFERLKSQLWRFVADDPEVFRKGDRLMPKGPSWVRP